MARQSTDFTCPHCGQPHEGQPIHESDNWVKWTCPKAVLKSPAGTMQLYTHERIEDLLTRDNEAVVKRFTNRLALISDICSVSIDLPRHQLRAVLDRVVALCKEAG